MKLAWLLIASVCGCVTAAEINTSTGDGFAGPGELVTLFHENDSRIRLQNELKLPEEKVKMAAELAEEFRSELERRHTLGAPKTSNDSEIVKQYNARIAELFPADQLERIKQISFRAKGGDALLEPELAAKLGLKNQQLQKLTNISQRVSAQYRQELDGLPRVTAEYVKKLEEQYREKK